jgi:2-polyprenyl-6-methoxyphenol hydroxylase-like FAD-dependent oxidoreductase
MLRVLKLPEGFRMQVIVVGAGPTGLMLAGELALAGIEVEVIERQAVASGQSRGGGVSARTAEVLAMRGLVDSLSEHAIRREAVGGHFAGLPVPLDTRPWRTRYPGGLFVPQDRIEQVLEEHLARLGVTVRRETSLTGLDAGPDGVTVTVDGPQGTNRLRSHYLVACDGAHSTVRALTGVDFPGQAGTMRAVSCDIDLASRSSTVPTRVDHISRLTRTTGDHFMLLHPLFGAGEDGTLYRAVFGGPEQMSLPRTAPVTEAEVARALTAVHGPETRLGRLRWGTRFSDASRQLAQYRLGRVLFAGDAAHIHSPVGGQGLNLGVQDAMNLGWKLAAHLRGDAPAGLLDTYHAERHPVAARAIATTKAQRVLMTLHPDAQDEQALRAIVTEMARLPDTNRYLAGLMSGLDIRYDLGGTDPLVGTRMPDLTLRIPDATTTGATTTRVSTLLHNGHGLLLDLRPDGEPGPRGGAAWPRDGSPVAAQRPGPEFGPVALPSRVDRVVAWPVESEIGTDTGAAPWVDRILIRPDGYVCWAGAGSGTPADPGFDSAVGSAVDIAGSADTVASADTANSANTVASTDILGSTSTVGSAGTANSVGTVCSANTNSVDAVNSAGTGGPGGTDDGVATDPTVTAGRTVGAALRQWFGSMAASSL